MANSWIPRPADLLHAGRGFLMGAADIVPGVSGGTVALVLGIYQRLLEAISHFDGQLLKLIAGRRFAEAAAHVDWRFLLSLGIGILTGAVCLAGLMHDLLEHHLALTFAGFFGLILASGWLVARMCRPKSAGDVMQCVAIGVIAAAAAFTLVRQNPMQGQEGYGYTFVCGTIAICAMILPGISGSYILLLLNKYHEVTGIVKAIPRGEATGGDLMTLVVFASGCLLGLILFSKLLRWLLDRCWTPTMAALCGFMIGSLYKIWPFQKGSAAEGADLKEKMLSLQPYLPKEMNSEVWICLAIATAAFLGVLAIDAVARQRAADKP